MEGFLRGTAQSHVVLFAAGYSSVLISAMAVANFTGMTDQKGWGLLVFTVVASAVYMTLVFSSYCGRVRIDALNKTLVDNITNGTVNTNDGDYYHCNTFVDGRVDVVRGGVRSCEKRQ